MPSRRLRINWVLPRFSSPRRSTRLTHRSRAVRRPSRQKRRLQSARTERLARRMGEGRRQSRLTGRGPLPRPVGRWLARLPVGVGVQIRSRGHSVVLVDQPAERASDHRGSWRGCGRAGCPRRSQGEPLRVSRSVSVSAVAPPRSSTQRTMALRVVARVLFVAKRRARGIQELDQSARRSGR